LFGLVGFVAPFVAADTLYYRHVFFDNSLEHDAYFYSSATVSAPSSLVVVNGKIPVESKFFYTPPNALRLEWMSASNGAWDARIDVMRFRNREISFVGGNLFFWCYSPEGIPGRALPEIRIIDTNSQFSHALKLREFIGDLPANRWTQIKIPLAEFPTASIHDLDPNLLESIVFSQDEPDKTPHTLLIDEIKVDTDSATASSTASAAGTTSSTSTPSHSQNLPSPPNLKATAYERHIDLQWSPVPNDQVERYVIYRALDNERTYQPIGMQVRGVTRFTDYLGAPPSTAHYKIATSDTSYEQSQLSASGSATTRAFTDDELLTMLQEECFRYYYEGAHPDSGTTLENIPGDDRNRRHRRQRFWHYGARCRCGSRLHHAGRRPRPPHENRRFPRKGSALPRRLVALHGRPHRGEPSRLQHVRQRRRSRRNRVPRRRSVSRASIFPSRHTTRARTLPTHHSTLDLGGMGLVPPLARRRRAVLALVARVRLAHKPPHHRL
jgi:hypothetical protein